MPCQLKICFIFDIDNLYGYIYLLFLLAIDFDGSPWMKIRREYNYVIANY